jgi:hypothetical protein
LLGSASIHGGDDSGPAGRMLVAWRGLDRSAPLCDESVFHIVETLQLKVDDGLRAAIADAQRLFQFCRHKCRGDSNLRRRASKRTHHPTRSRSEVTVAQNCSNRSL